MISDQRLTQETLQKTDNELKYASILSIRPRFIYFWY